MIIFTITNKISGRVYVGCTRNDLQKQWKKIVDAAGNKLNFPLYNEIRTHGPGQFVIDEYEYAETPEEAKKIEQEIIKFFNAESLRGYKTSNVIIKKEVARKKNERDDLRELFSINPFAENETENSLIFEKDLKQIHGEECESDEENDYDQQEQAFKTDTDNKKIMSALTPVRSFLTKK